MISHNHYIDRYAKTKAEVLREHAKRLDNTSADKDPREGYVDAYETVEVEGQGVKKYIQFTDLGDDSVKHEYDFKGCLTLQFFDAKKDPDWKRNGVPFSASVTQLERKGAKMNFVDESFLQLDNGEFETSRTEATIDVYR